MPSMSAVLAVLAKGCTMLPPVFRIFETSWIF